MEQNSEENRKQEKCCSYRSPIEPNFQLPFLSSPQKVSSVPLTSTPLFLFVNSPPPTSSFSFFPYKLLRVPVPLLTAQFPLAPLLIPPPWQGGHILATRPMHVAHLVEVVPHSLLQRCPTLPGWPASGKKKLWSTRGSTLLSLY